MRRSLCICIVLLSCASGDADDVPARASHSAHALWNEDVIPDEGGGTGITPPVRNLHDLEVELVERLRRRGYTVDDLRAAAERGGVDDVAAMLGMSERELAQYRDAFIDAHTRARRFTESHARNHRDPGLSIEIDGGCNYIGLGTCLALVDPLIALGPGGWVLALIGNIQCQCNYCWGGVLEHFCPALRTPDPDARGGES